MTTTSSAGMRSVYPVNPATDRRASCVTQATRSSLVDASRHMQRVHSWVLHTFRQALHRRRAQRDRRPAARALALRPTPGHDLGATSPPPRRHPRRVRPVHGPPLDRPLQPPGRRRPGGPSTLGAPRLGSVGLGRRIRIPPREPRDPPGVPGLGRSPSSAAPIVPSPAGPVSRVARSTTAVRSLRPR
jgi:hypothetical protein